MRQVLMAVNRMFVQLFHLLVLMSLQAADTF